jgi:hypothetical protein
MNKIIYHIEKKEQTLIREYILHKIKNNYYTYDQLLADLKFAKYDDIIEILINLFSDI